MGLDCLSLVSVHILPTARSFGQDGHAKSVFKLWQGSMMTICNCFYCDVDPETIDEDNPDGVCACGHVPDEHDEFGDCQAEVEEL